MALYWVKKPKGLNFLLSRFKNLVGQVGQGKSQSQDFIDKLRGSGRTLDQLMGLACWYLLSNTDCIFVAFCAPNCGLLTIVDNAFSFRGALLNFKDCRYSTNLSEWVFWFKYPVLCLLLIPGGWVHLFWMVVKNPLFGLLPCLFLFWFVPCLCSSCISLLRC